MRPVQAIMDMLRSPHAIARGIANESEMLNQKFDVLSQAMDNQSKLLNERLKALIQGMDNQSGLLNDKLYKLDASLAKVGEKMDAFMRSQIVMQRDQAEAIGVLTAAIEELSNPSKSCS